MSPLLVIPALLACCPSDVFPLFLRVPQVYMEIVGGNQDGVFWLHPDTGMLYTAKLLDAELKTSYALTVSALDQGNAGARKQSSARVQVTVLDANDNDPVFETPEQTVWVNENEPPGQQVARVVARDRDSGENAYISYLIANLGPVPFEVDHFTGWVRTTQVLNYEVMKREYVLRIRASDWGLPYRRQTETTLRVHVRDVNDNRPQFERVDCVGHVPRHLAIGTDILTLSAIDFDDGSVITYRLEGGSEDGCFALDSSSGMLQVTCDLADVRAARRELNVHVVTVRATDRGTPALWSEAALTVHLIDVNENAHAPLFDDLVQTAAVLENATVGTLVTSVKASDADAPGDDSRITFSIRGGDGQGYFSIDDKGKDTVLSHRKVGGVGARSPRVESAAARPNGLGEGVRLRMRSLAAAAAAASVRRESFCCARYGVQS
ncbi:hypothetical protein FOCC_FOCC003837, partial [Frankliniella occidentalis]